jgi:hypothetical protein
VLRKIWAKFGYFYLHKTNGTGKQIVPALAQVKSMVGGFRYTPGGPDEKVYTARASAANWLLFSTTRTS